MEDDAQFFRDGDMFDVELDAEISVETMALKKERMAEVEEIARQNAKKKKVKDFKRWQKFDKNKVLSLDELSDGIGTPSSQPKKKIPGTYARHGIEFKLRKEAEYVEGSNDEKDDILSDCNSDE
ncbi:hypothetical protein Leryth_017879 [Lithospermum erythrorhizon]|nr:hypothetical protein Leryth_017879 [Lithospermum erythrorhizon]